MTGALRSGEWLTAARGEWRLPDCGSRHLAIRARRAGHAYLPDPWTERLPDGAAPWRRAEAGHFLLAMCRFCEA